MLKSTMRQRGKELTVKGCGAGPGLGGESAAVATWGAGWRERERGEGFARK
jgi:hypothetical protein